MDLKEQLIQATIEEVSNKNFKFTMAELAKKLGISKKTIYAEFLGKEDLLYETVDYFFGEIKKCEKKIIENKELDVVERLKKVLIVMPDIYQNIDIRSISDMKDKYPKVYKRVAEHLITGWEPTFLLYRQAVAEGKLRQVSETVFKLIVEGTMQEFMSNKELVENNITYEAALEEMIEIIFKGLEL